MPAIKFTDYEIRILFRLVYAMQWDAEKRIRHAHSHGDTLYKEPERVAYESIIEKLHGALLHEKSQT